MNPKKLGVTPSVNVGAHLEEDMVTDISTDYPGMYYVSEGKYFTDYRGNRIDAEITSFNSAPDAENPLEKQVGGSHYKDFEIQPIEFIQKNKLDFIQGCIIKYACRAGNKGAIKEDINKIIHYCELWKTLC